MKLEDTSNLGDLDVNFFEYCIVEEKTFLPAEKVKVKIPKLTISTRDGELNVTDGILVNDDECKPKVGTTPVKIMEAIYVKTFSGLELSKSAVITKKECGCRVVNHTLIRDCLGDNKTFIDGHIVEAYLPKGAQMIVCFMEKNINDAYLTNFL